MLLWFAGMSVVLVWAVLRDPAVDYRLVMVGALLPDVVDGALGGAGPLHSVTAAGLVLLAVMLATRHRRILRRHLLAVPFGLFLHLLLDGLWTRPAVFWWPFLGRAAGINLPSLSHPLPVQVAEELSGALALAWAWRRFRLFEAGRRAHLLRTGRLGRDLVA